MYKVIDLFAGAGGLSLGFEETEKFKIMAFVENNPNATKTYRTNNPNVTHYKDILKLDFNKVRKEVGEIDLVIGGPPCQGFSNANRQRRKIINGSNELVKKYVEAISVLKPNVFVMENVKTIASNKHFFCLTDKDSKYVKDDLGVEIHYEKLLLYCRNEYLSELHESIINGSYKTWAQIEEQQLYVLKNMLSKLEDSAKFKKFIDKRINCKVLEDIGHRIEIVSNEPQWLHELHIRTNEAVTRIISTKKVTEEDQKTLHLFSDVERLFIGINELHEHKAEFDIELNKNDITIILHAYIVMEFIKKSFQYFGYEIKGDVLNAANFGVPQSRERYIIIGVERNYLNGREILLPEPIIKDESKYVTVENAIEDLVTYEPTTEKMSVSFKRDMTLQPNKFLEQIIYKNSKGLVYNHVTTETTEEARERFKHIKQGQNFHSLPKELKKSYSDPSRTQNTIYKRLKYDSPSDTVVNVRKSMWIHPTKDRAISAREAARLQSFPDYYEFVGTKDSVYQQIGNAVPPLLGRAIAEKVLDIIEPENEHTELRETFKNSILSDSNVNAPY